ncbi:hypothetical protein HYX06_03830 [Candidatus Woesearchaeota archaeon]|nr:hypothetical protein [Candidatus Woesearchaeota archaeon]
MANSKKIFISAILIVMLLSAACSVKNPFSSKDSAKKTKTEELRTGTDGLKIRFLPNNPPPTIFVGSSGNLQNKIDIAVEIVNRGVYPQPEERQPITGKLYLSGYDKNIIEFASGQQPFFDLSKSTALFGKTLINSEGGSEVATFSPQVKFESMRVDKYEPIILATLCYEYKTIAGPSVCIDPDPYPTVKQKKVCEVKNIILTSQGAPIAVTKVEEKALSEKTQFMITVKNVGLGDVLRIRSDTQQTQGAFQAPAKQSGSTIEKCDPFGSSKITKEDIDKVYVEGISIGDKFLDCWPFAESTGKSGKGHIRLQNGEGSIICELQKDYISTGTAGYPGGSTAYTTPLRIELSYIYKTTAETKTLLKKEDTGE